MPTFVRTQEIEHEIGERGRLALRVTNPDVQMRGDDGTVARLRVTFEIRAASDVKADEIFDALRYQVTQAVGSLEVTEPKHGPGAGLGSPVHLFGIGSDRVDTSVEVDAPRLADLRYDGVSADVTAIGFRGTQEYRTVSGDLVLDRIGGDIRVKGVSSDISLRAEAPLASLEINTVSGDISGVAPRIEQLRATTVSGDLDLEGTLADGPEHRIETVSGDASLGVTDNLTLEVRGLSTDADIRLPHRSEGSRDRRRYIIGNGGPQLLFSSMSGDIEIRQPRRSGSAPPPPAPIAPPAPPRPPSVDDDDQLAVLRALERGEIDVEEATRRLGGRTGTDV
jgi:putative adhesin